MTFKFGDKLENGYASEDNPTKRGYFVRFCRAQNLPCVEVTDGKGKFWKVIFDKEHRITKIGDAPLWQ